MLTKILTNTYSLLKYLFYILYFAALLGVWSNAPMYLNLVNESFKIFVAVVLIYFFNPLKKTQCTDFHREIVFSAALFLIFSSSISSILHSFI